MKNHYSYRKSLLFYILILIVFQVPIFSFAQVAINTSGDNPNESAMLDISSTSKGILIPRTNIGNISSPATGLLIYDTSLSSLMFYDGVNWVSVRTIIQDVDADTKIQVEESSNDNVIRFDIAGVEKWKMQGSRLESNNTGNSIFIGENAGLLDDLSSNQNIFIGNDAGSSNISGSLNLSIGNNALSNNSTGSDNVALGNSTLASNIIGSKNVGIGVGSLILSQSGLNNTAIGHQAGFSSIGNSNVFIGYQAGFGETGSSKLYIENSNSTSPLIYGDFETDLLRINGVLNINNVFSFPTTDGSVNQVLQTNGSGSLSWADVMDTDDQNLSLDGTTLNITDGTGADLSSLLDNTDAQNLSISGSTLSISGGNNVDLPVGIPSTMEDADGNTKIQVEESSNENIIRMDVDGVEVVKIDKTSGGYPRMNLTNGNENTIIGNFAGNSLTTGYNNIMIGRDAGKFANTANRNVFIGFDAGESSSSAIGCTYVGQEAGDKANSNFNTFIGAWAGLLTTSGGENTFLGQDAGIFNTTGARNTYLGRKAGEGNSTGSDNVFIGNQAGASETGSNKLYIANTNTGTPLIWGDFSNNRLGIARHANTNALEVEGEASKSSAGDWLANSDARLKKNIQEIKGKDILHKLLQLRGITYEWNDSQTGTKRPLGVQYGFTAQNIQSVFPELVEEDAKGYLQTGYGTYDAMYIEAIRALNNELEHLKKENQQFKSQLTILMQEIADIRSQQQSSLGK